MHTSDEYVLRKAQEWRRNIKRSEGRDAELIRGAIRKGSLNIRDLPRGD